MLKRVTAIFLVIAMALSLAACGGSSSGSADKDDDGGSENSFGSIADIKKDGDADEALVTLAREQVKASVKHGASANSVYEEMRETYEELRGELSRAAPKSAEIYTFTLDKDSREELGDELFAKAVFSCATQINADIGENYLAVCSMLSTGNTYPLPRDFEGVRAVLLEYDNIGYISVFHATENGTLTVSSCPVADISEFDDEAEDWLEDALDSFDLHRASLELEKKSMAPDTDTSLDDCRLVSAKKCPTDTDGLIDEAVKAAEKVGKLAENGYMQQTTSNSEVIDLCDECDIFGSSPEAAIVWYPDSSESDAFLLYIDAQSIGQLDGPASAFVSILPQQLVANAGVITLAANSLMTVSTSYLAEDDAEAALIWLIYGDIHDGDVTVCSVSFSVTDTGCIAVKACPLWSVDPIPDAIGWYTEHIKDGCAANDDTYSDWLTGGEFIRLD